MISVKPISIRNWNCATCVVSSIYNPDNFKANHIHFFSSENTFSTSIIICDDCKVELINKLK